MTKREIHSQQEVENNIIKIINVGVKKTINFAKIYIHYILKKLIAIITIFIILYNTIGNLIVLESMYYSIHNDIRTQLIKSIPINNLITFKIEITSKIKPRFVDNDEFIYNGKMYDVIKKENIGNTTIYYCLNDTKEDELFLNLNKEVKNTMESNPVQNKTQQILKKINIPLFYEVNKDYHINISKKVIFPNNILTLNYTFIDVLTPPPVLV